MEILKYIATFVVRVFILGANTVMFMWNTVAQWVKDHTEGIGHI